PVFTGRAIEIVTCEQQDVGPAVTERGQLDRDDREAMVEVLAESPGANRGGQILTRRRQHPRVGRFGASAAEAPDRMILERLEQLGLEAVRHEANLVEEDRAAMRDLQKTSLGLLRVREGSTLEPEELRFEQR